MSGVTVIGDGAWGTTLAILLARNGHKIVIWSPFSENADSINRDRENSKYLPAVPIPDGVSATSDMDSVSDSRTVVSAVPTKFMSVVFRKFGKTSFVDADVCSVSKGIDHDTLQRPSEILAALTGAKRICVLSGPAHAEEVSRGMPTAVVIGSYSQEAALKFQELFSSEFFRVYTSSDMKGVEFGGAFKNVIAIAAGICDGIGLGDNAKSAMMTRGLEEIRRLGGSLGAERSTFFGLSGMGDLITTCVSPFGRNRSVGERLGKGEKLDDIVASMTAVAEGVLTTRSVCSLADEHSVDVPISREVYNVAFEGKDPRHAVRDLMLRNLKYEF